MIAQHEVDNPTRLKNLRHAKFLSEQKPSPNIDDSASSYNCPAKLNTFVPSRHESQHIRYQPEHFKLVTKRTISLVLLLLLQYAASCSSYDDFGNNYHPDFPGRDDHFLGSIFSGHNLMPNIGIDSLFRNVQLLFSLIPSFMQDQSDGSTPPEAAKDSRRAIESNLDYHIRKILVPRVSGSRGNIQVREYIASVLRRNNYHVELDEFVASTPIGDVRFANIIASSSPASCRQLVFACHYDSKMMDNFLGATDSAVPCAMLLKAAEKFNESFRSDIGLRFIFFDGEEAFVQWTSTDSLYGSRHLVAKWAMQPAPQACGKKNELARIELFVLLDLIGTSDSTFVSYSQRERQHYEDLQKHESAYLKKAGLTYSHTDLAFGDSDMAIDSVEDDHVPFKQQGVPILLLLSHPFPKVWHTSYDNYNAIDFRRTARVQYALEEFIANYSQRVRTSRYVHGDTVASSA